MGALEPATQPTLASRAVAAELVDQGDFYLHPDGRKIRFYRKKDVYAIRYADVHRDQTESRIQAKFGAKALLVSAPKTVSGHYLIQLDRAAMARIGLPANRTGIRSLDPSLRDIEPVFANAHGQGDVVMSNGFIVRFTSGLDAEAALNTVVQRYSLMLDKRLRIPGTTYSMHSRVQLSVAERFGLARALTADPLVAWAQPTFYTQVSRHAYEPDDTLFPTQWHLRNTGQGGARCDTDCDANNAWGINGGMLVAEASGHGSVIAIIDDGVQLDHEDLSIWQNEVEASGTPGVDDDGNGYIDDVNGYDFVDDGAGVSNICGDDGIAGVDADPSPQIDTACVDLNGDDVVQDNHGTAVAGIAAAIGDNAMGVAGAAFSAKILPIRLVSDFDADPNGDFCQRAAEAIAYAGRYADVINNSWGLVQGTCPTLDVVINDVVSGALMDDMVNVSKRPSLGSPVIFSAGNNGSGWIKVTVPVSSGKHAYEWRFQRAAFPEFYNDFAEQDSVWLDDVTFPNGATESFNSGIGDFTASCALNSCDGDCTGETLSSCPTWQLESDPDYARSGQSLRIDGESSYCSYSYLHTQRDGPAGDISFWVWVSTDLQVGSDKFEFLIDGEEVLSFGDLAQLIDNDVSYPANLSTTIAVGASDAGDLSGQTTASLVAEERVYYSQFGATLDVLAPSSNQHLGIVTTDRYGVAGEGYNTDQNIGGSAVADVAYTASFGGTSASAPLVSGVVAAMIGFDNTGGLTATQIRHILRATADKIGRRGPAAYPLDGGNQSLFYGYGRVNMFAALRSVRGLSDADAFVCSPSSFSYQPTQDPVLNFLQPIASEGFCPAAGPLVPDDGLCFPVKTTTGTVGMVCL